jgi:hypothetical protein
MHGVAVSPRTQAPEILRFARKSSKYKKGFPRFPKPQVARSNLAGSAIFIGF